VAGDEIEPFRVLYSCGSRSNSPKERLDLP
jgi:hypothetical protein